MKKGIIFIILLLTAFGLQAQTKQARDSVKVGNKAFAEQRYGTAESSYQAAIELDPSSKEAVFNLANTYYKQNKLNNALEEYKRYLTIETEKTENMSAAFHNIGNVMLKNKDLQNAMEAYKNALRLNPLDDQTRYNLAVVKKMIQDQKDKEKQDQNKDKKDQEDKKDQDKKDQQNPENNQDDKKNKKPEKKENEQMSQDNARQMLQAIEQDEKETQERVKKMKAEERRRQNASNKRQNKDW